MAEPQYLSTDPHAGQPASLAAYLSTDPAAAAQAAIPRDARGRPLVTSDTSDAPPSGIAGWFETKLRPLLEQVAHPQTIADIAQLLIPDAGLTGTVRAGAKAVAATGRGLETVAQSPVVQKTADAIGAAAAFLLSHSAAYITGVTLPVDGGLRLA